MCKVSVVTSVYNCEKYIAETIESVINQSFEDWEFIIINDCSKDKSGEIIKRFDDKRIRFIDNQSNQGQCNNLNRGISMARGQYIARLDHDDICYPDRFIKQVEYMDAHPEIVLCGSWMDFWENGRISKRECPKIKGADELGFSLAFGVYCTPHSSYMIRKSAMIDNNIWYGDYLYAEDYDLLLKLIKVGKIDYIPESLIIYRIFQEQCTQVYSQQLINAEKDKVRCAFLNKEKFDEKEILQKGVTRQLCTLKDYKRFLKAFTLYADYCGVSCQEQELTRNECLRMVYHEVCMLQQYNISMLISYLISPLSNSNWLLSSNGLKFIIKCIIHYHH